MDLELCIFIYVSYAQVLVHRLLAASIDLHSLPDNMTRKNALTRQCERMNIRNRNARNASRASSDFFSYLFFKDKVIIEKGMISSIQNQGFTILVDKYGLEALIEFSDEDLRENAAIADQGKGLTEFSSRGVNYKIFDWVKVKIEVTLKSFRKVIHFSVVFD